ncbi:hypothetical protein TNCV_2788861 [Trichonephila clavipes]|uniref:Uncharacterized protein n=1 Tax=Trichonephila clavipes TaxID=2585209 RepID=A0A8X6SR53_TRICX|nr:hypothetical protein TNCV_2788781 [Trichonephila clavipes]GFY16764.1 hypothetical protein TNCV_2788861 [Trichonephila clavipes]
MGVEPEEFSVSAMKLLDRERLMKAIYAFSGRSKKIRKDKRRKRKKEEDNIKKNKVKTGYSAGSFDEVLDESRSFFRVHTGYFSNIPKCIKAEFIASWGCSQSSVVSSSQR